jgi:hypothetical protein
VLHSLKQSQQATRVYVCVCCKKASKNLKLVKGVQNYTNLKIIPNLIYLLEPDRTSNRPQQLNQEVLCTISGADATGGCMSIQFSKEKLLK